MTGKLYGAIHITDERELSSSRASQTNIETKPLLFGSPSWDNPSATSTILNNLKLSCSNFWSNLTFDWISPLLELGNSRGQLNIEDLSKLPLPKDCETEIVYADFLNCWKQELKTTQNQVIEKSKFTAINNGQDSEVDTLKMEILSSIHSPQHPKQQPSLIRALYHAFGKDFLCAGIYKLVHDSNLFVGPLVLNKLIKFLRDDSATLSDGIYLVAVVTFSQIIMSITLRHYFYKCYICGLRIRTAVIIAIYKKSFLLSLKERHVRGGAGEITNLVGIDAQRMQDLMTYLHAVWYSFFQIGLALYFLHKQVGLAMLAGVCVILFLIPSTRAIAAYLGSIQKKLMKARDERVALNTEILGNMKIIKVQAWEENFRHKLLGLRFTELKSLKHYFFTSAVSVSLYSSTPLLVALATFAAYTISGHTLDVAEALTALSLFDVLRFPLFMLPQIINRIVEAGISFERVREFLLADEYKSVGEGRLKKNGEVWMKNGTFVYDSKKPTLPDQSDSKKPRTNIEKLYQQNRRLIEEAILDRQWEMVLLKAQLLDAEEKVQELSQKVNPELVFDRNDIQVDGWSPSSLLSLRRVYMHINPGEFVAVVGSVGAGKSTLINSLLGEGRPLTGAELAYKGQLGVFLQTPFIMNDTLRNNILFGHKSSSIDEERYQLAIKVCSLAHDLRTLSAGDQTEIGEKGITLSGGQKARVALARAVYHDAAIYLLDDPLAAVDAHVGKDLFNNCIVNEMLLGESKKQKSISANGDIKSTRNATVILVTNALQYLNHPRLDKIICLDDGCVAEVGTYADLSSNPESKFASYLQVMVETGKVNDQILDRTEDAILFEGDARSNNGMETSDEPDVAKIVEPIFEPSSPQKESLTKNMSISVDQEADKGGALMSDEFKERVIGCVGRQVYIDWAEAAGGIAVIISILSLFVFVEALTVSSKWWLTHWSQNGGSNTIFYLGIYAFINFSVIFATWGRLLLFNFSSVKASESIFEKLLDVVLDAPMVFFDTTPIGRIVNRFSKDVYTVDEQLVVSARSYMSTMMSVLSTIIVVVSVTPGFLIALAPIVVFYLHQQNFFTMAYRELKRLDSVSRSPIYALLGETIDGVLTIRAYGAEKNLTARMLNMLDVQQTAYHLTFSAQCWLSVRLEFAGSMIVMATCLVSVLGHRRDGDASFAGLAGFAISFALSVTQSLNWTVRMASDVEANMVAVERIQQYFKIQGEAPRLTPEDVALPNWPMYGGIEFVGAKLRYRNGLPLVLKGLTFRIPPQAKVGVVGRTGAGKSTLMVALLRIVELDSGSINIDGVDIKHLGLKKLRSNIAVIPQDPVLFSGNVRTNLDPFGEYHDEKLFEVLHHVGLYNPMGEREPSKSSLTADERGNKSGGRSQPIKSLSDEIAEGGSNFSVGQRQLLVIARSMLTGARIVIMDEATASVDADTDARIQRVFREHFKDATCITVAHRLNTIMDSDLVLCMDNGRAAEFDKPSTLLSTRGIFKDLVDAWEEEN